MSGLGDFIKRLVGGRRVVERSRESVEELRAVFRRRYEAFRLLLTSNSKALEIMTDMEIALQGNRPFGMSFVRSRCTAVSVNVYKIIKHLNELAPGKYTDLFERFKLIEAQIDEAMSQSAPSLSGPLTVPLSSVDNTLVDLVGGKMVNLGILKNRLGLEVPRGFVITSSAYEAFMRYDSLRAEISRQIQESGAESLEALEQLSVDLQQLIVRSRVPSDVESAILKAYRDLESEAGTAIRVSVRSSALGEDIAGRAFAGQFRSELNVSPETLIKAYKEVVASKYGLAAIAYRLNRGIPDESTVMCVGVMEMMCSAAGGVIYSSNPMNPRDRTLIIHSVIGLPKAVVDSSVPADVFVVEKGDPLEIRDKEVPVKQQKFVCYPDEGVSRVDLSGEEGRPQSITDEQILRLAVIAVRLEDALGGPQDIEWCVTGDGAIYILQCRPLQLWLSTSRREKALSTSRESFEVIASGETTASPGVGIGPVFLVKNDFDKLRFPEGAVLVTSHAAPAWAPLLGRAAAVVTEVGSMAGHLANVAREFRVPALFGVPAATSILNSGELITVDADGMTIYRGRLEALLDLDHVPRHLMEGSPVLRALERVAAYVIPLNLIDPDSPEFHPKKCQTYHDITRFAHELSVQEMFNFGKDHQFAERGSKRLVCEVPMQWWVINLDDGFKEPVDGELVNLENICSVPMLALWRGVTAIPWAGPPGVDAGGFLSVLMQSASNPALDPAVSSPYAARNYFMISKNFCSLMSRFGFHFSIVEALVSDRPQENYVGFTFKGGAADLRRRVKRAQLLAGILREYDFRVNVREDSVVSRVDNRDEEFMKSRLVILGHLIMHTRQLDMIMASDSAVQSYRANFVKDIESLLRIQ